MGKPAALHTRLLAEELLEGGPGHLNPFLSRSSSRLGPDEVDYSLRTRKPNRGGEILNSKDQASSRL